METQDELDLGTAPDDLQQGQSDATLLKQVPAFTSVLPISCPVEAVNTKNTLTSWCIGHDQRKGCA